MIETMTNPSIPTGYHFHNFFDTNYQVPFKYKTYGHSNENAMDLPMLRYGVKCAKLGGDNDTAAHMPIYYIDDYSRNTRHQLWLDIVKEDEERFNRTYVPDTSQDIVEEEGKRWNKD